jgi:competence protein ComEC
MLIRFAPLALLVGIACTPAPVRPLVPEPPVVAPSARPQPAPSPTEAVRPGRAARTSPDERITGPLDDLRAASIAPSMRAHLIDVGQGAATLFEFSCGTVLVDTGAESNAQFNGVAALTSYLDGFFEERPHLNNTIDLLVITHAHKDHALGAEQVTANYTVKNVVTNGFVKKAGGGYHSGGRAQEKLEAWAKAKAKLQIIEADKVGTGGLTSNTIDPLKCSDVDPQLSVLWGHLKTQPAGWPKKAFEDANNHSVALRVGFGRASLLVTGDLEEEGIEALLARHKASPASLDVDVWQVSHHGSKNGANASMVGALTPQIALLGTGAAVRREPWTAWDYGHPNKGIVELLVSQISRERSTVEVEVGTGSQQFEPYQLSRAIYATGWDGNVVVTATNAGKFRTQTQR